MNKTKSLTTEKVASLGVFVLLSIFPLILTDKYFNITVTRYLFFTISSAFFLALCLLIKIHTIDNPRKIKKPQLSDFSAADISFALYVIVAAASSFSSGYGVVTISGGGGRRMGLLMIVSMFLAYIFISRFYRIREYEFIFFGIVGAFMSLFGMLQFIGLDPLGLLERLSELDKVRFISFSGNINIYSSFICLVLPLAMYMFCFSEKLSNSVFWLLITSATFIGLLTTISDSGYLGLAAALVVLAVLTAKGKKTFQRFFVVIITVLITSGIFDLVWKTFGDPDRPNSVFNKIIANPWVIAAGSIISALIIIGINLIDLSEKAFSRIRRFIIIAAVAAVVACVGLVIWFTFFNTDADLGRFNNYLKFSDKWGNGRGYAWKKLLEIFAELPIHKKLIGTGPDTIAYEMVARHNDEMIELFDFYFDNAHNDLIQYLVTLGLWGMLTYVSLVGSAVSSCFKAKNQISRAMLLPIVAFFAQSLVNVTQPITTPLFFVFLAFTQCRTCEEGTQSSI